MSEPLREPPIPQELLDALAADPEASAIFAQERTEHRRAHIRWVERSLSSQGRRKRAEIVISTLHAHERSRARAGLPQRIKLEP